jgi:hypothetical protein
VALNQLVDSNPSGREQGLAKARVGLKNFNQAGTVQVLHDEGGNTIATFHSV